MTKKQADKIRQNCKNKCKEGHECLACYTKIHNIPDKDIIWMGIPSNDPRLRKIYDDYFEKIYGKNMSKII